MLHKIKARLSEPYRIRIGYGLSPIRTKREYEALMQFCREQLLEDRIVPKRKRVFEFTLELDNLADLRIEDNVETGTTLVFDDGTHYRSVLKFIEDHTGYYWG